MLELLGLVPTLPLLSFLILVLFGSRFPRLWAAILGAGSVGLSALLTILIALKFILTPPPGHVFSQTIWTWMQVAGFSPGITVYLDALSLVFILVITFVGFFIHLYSAEFMYEEEGYSRFFAYMNLFVGSMLILVLANNMLFLYLGWEGVGLCSYLLIGFWYKDPANGYAARKAFVVTRVGDTAMAIGLILLFTNLGTLNIQELMQHASQQWEVGSSIAIAIAILLLGGAVGKSAQLPLQTWLPDAMAGPTPVSALIHAATMVTAGVYLIARTHVIFELAPVVQTLVAIVGAITLLISGFSAITQVDIKRVLAYSTISQIGYMFLALGVGAWSAAVFHFMIHAFFKALLFLGAGVIILTLHHEHNMFKMGGLRKQLPVVFWTFLIASGALSAFPLITAGFYSKDQIIWYAWSSKSGNPLLWVAGLVGAFLTSIYTFRMVFITFFGEAKAKITHKPGLLLKVPLIVLAVLSVIGGFIELPHTLGNFTPFSDFLHNTLPAVRAFKESMTLELMFQVITAVTSLIGIYLAYFFIIRNPEYVRQFRSSGSGALLQRFLFAGWGFDWLYDKVIVYPYVWLAQIDKQDFIDLIFEGLARGSRLSHRILSQTQTGFLRKYAMGIAIGAIIAIGVVIFL
jgi:NADH-quinone oxidoreductase subunit L